jgi:glutathione peroxidase
MKQLIFILTIFIMTTTINGQKKLHNFTVKDITGTDFNLDELKGKKVLVVNTASKCGFTPQFGELEKLYQKYKDDNFVIIGFPSNDFLNQDPGSNEEIAEFCKINYGVTFPMMSKVKVKGSSKDPVYKWLTSKDENGVMNSKVKWNFQKYMIDENGKLFDYLKPKESPNSEKIINWIEG